MGLRSSMIALLLGSFLVMMSSPPVPAGTAPPLGILLGPTGDANGTLPAGIGWAVASADWSRIEPAPGRFRWSPLDSRVREVAKRGLRVVVMMAGTPRWAALTPQAPPEVWRHQPPRSIGAWASFVAALVSRYRSRISAWLVEPSLDLADFRGTTADYLQMLRVVRGTVREKDPGALVVAAAPPGLDLPYLGMLARRAGSEFDAVLLWPKDRTPEDVLEALSVIRARGILGTTHQLWLATSSPANPLPSPEPVRMTVAALAGGARVVLWPAGEGIREPSRAALLRTLSDLRFVGVLTRGPGVVAVVFAGHDGPLAALWSTQGPLEVPLGEASTLSAVTADGQPVRVSGSGGTSRIPVDARPILVRGLPPEVVEEARQTAQRGPFHVPRDPSHDFSQASQVSATLGATNVEQGLYNQRFRTLPPGRVVPITVDGTEAVRTDQSRDAVYVYFDVDHTFAYFVNGSYDLLVTVVVHRARAPHRVGFDLLYDSMSGYRFTPWQWVDAGDGWASYTIRLTDAAFCSTWGWDFAINGAGNRVEELVVRSVTVQKVPPAPSPRSP